MSDEKTIRYFVKFYHSTCYAFEFDVPENLPELKELIKVTGITDPVNLLLMDEVKLDPKTETTKDRFNSLITTLIELELERCVYFNRTNRDDVIELELVLKAKPKSLNKFVVNGQVPLAIDYAKLLDSLDSIESIKELLSQG
jgi:hypothetical protein